MMYIKLVPFQNALSPYREGIPDVIIKGEGIGLNLYYILVRKEFCLAFHSNIG